MTRVRLFVRAVATALAFMLLASAAAGSAAAQSGNESAASGADRSAVECLQ